MTDRATSVLLDAIERWRSTHRGDPRFGEIDSKLQSLQQTLKTDSDTNTNKKLSGKPSFPTEKAATGMFGGVSSARGGHSS